MTGLDLWSKEGAFNTLGLAHTGGMCKPAYSCLVTEFGTRKNHVHQLNNDYPPHNGFKLQKPAKNQIKKKFVNLTNFEYEAHTLTGNGSHVNLMKFAWNNLLNHINLSYFCRVLAIQNHCAPVDGRPDQNTEQPQRPQYGPQYPSAGFGTSFILAHEIGHSLGMRHDDHQGCTKV